MPKKDLVLASGSESRKIMLTEAGLDFSVKPSSVDESVIKEEMEGQPFDQQVIALACAKAKEVSQNFPEAIVIGGDQMCIYNNEVFDKPGTREKAISNLLKLSGTSHCDLTLFGIIRFLLLNVFSNISNTFSSRCKLDAKTFVNTDLVISS